MPTRILGRLAFLASLAIGVVLGVLVSVLVLRSTGRDRTVAVAQARPAAPRPALDADERATIELFKSASKSVAYITTSARRVDFWTRNVFEVPQGTGSGFVWDDQGHVVTNFHVIQGASRAEVTLGEDAFEASLVGAFPDQDLAVLSIKAAKDKLSAMPIGTSADLQVGQKVFAIGNPFGLDHTLSTGIVSALDRTIQSANNRPIDGVIQTDAAINPGNSGGPLLDSAGRLIGVNTAILSPSGASAGIGFAIPVDAVNRVVSELITHGKVVRPRMGITLDDRVSAIVTQRLGVEGVLLIDVESGSPAEAAGLVGTKQGRVSGFVPGDIVQEVEGKKVHSRDELLGRLSNYRPGDTVTLTVFREDQVRKVKVRLEAAR